MTNQAIFDWIKENKGLTLKIVVLMITVIMFSVSISYYYAYNQIADHLVSNFNNYCMQPENNGTIKLNCPLFRSAYYSSKNIDFNLSTYILYNESS